MDQNLGAVGLRLDRQALEDIDHLVPPSGWSGQSSSFRRYVPVAAHHYGVTPDLGDPIGASD